MTNRFILKWWLISLCFIAPVIIFFASFNDKHSMLKRHELALISIPVALAFSIPTVLVTWILNVQLRKTNWPRPIIKLVLNTIAIAGAGLTLLWLQPQAPLLMVIYSFSVALASVVAKYR